MVRGLMGFHEVGTHFLVSGIFFTALPDLFSYPFHSQHSIQYLHQLTIQICRKSLIACANPFHLVACEKTIFMISLCGHRWSKTAPKRPLKIPGLDEASL